MAVLLILLAARLLAYRAESSVVRNGNETAEFSLARYEPMTRLLAEDDFEFLSAQAGFRPEIGAKLRRRRKQILRLYVRELAADFHRLHAAARRIAAESPADHAALVAILMRQQLTFWRAMAMLEVRLMIPGMTVDVRGLVEAVEGMRVDLAQATIA
jgi:arginyl-tRNA synthetase